MITVKCHEIKNSAVFKCECCGARAEVMSVYGEHEELYCASCFVKKTLPKMNVLFTKDDVDFDGAVVGQSYHIESYNYDTVPTEYGWKKCSHLKRIAEAVLYLGDEEYSGKRHKQFKVVLKPEYRNCRGAGYFNKVDGLSALEWNSRRWMELVVKDYEKKLQA